VIDDQLMEQRPTYRAGFALDITLGLMKTPQEKKHLSLTKDRRNTYGENSKASRKGIPLAKARANRAERHAQDHLLSSAVNSSEEDDLTTLEVKVKGTKPRQWRKSPDTPLGEVLMKRAARRKITDGSS
jgi:hypothetical protein